MHKGGVCVAEKPMKPCKRTGCTALTREGWCDKHKPDWRGRERKASQAWHWMYRTKWWRDTRELVLLQDPWCRECAAYGVRTRATEVDHTVPHKGNRHLFYDRSNLAPLCHQCHSRKTMQEQNAERGAAACGPLPPP